MLAEFDPATGYLPVGLHLATWPEVHERFGTNRHRRGQLAQLERVLLALRSVGCANAILDGSFVTAKERPRDFDLVFEDDAVQPQLVPDWLFDPELAGGDVNPIDYKTVGGRHVLDALMFDREGVGKGVVRISLSSLGTQPPQGESA